MKKLIPALALLLVSVVLLSTSSFAWFSMNTEVTATGMQVQAATSKNLVISGAADSGAFTAIGTQDSAVKELPPVSVNCASNADLNSKTFYKISNSDGVIYETGALTSGTTELTAATANSDYRKSVFTIAVDGVTGDHFDHLYVSAVTVTKSDGSAYAAEITKCLRVGVTDGTTSYIFAPDAEGAYTDGKSVSNYVADGKVTTLTAQSLAETGLSNADFGSITQGTNKTVTIYVWYEGNDVNCTSANSVTVEGLKVSVTFVGSMNPNP